MDKEKQVKTYTGIEQTYHWLIAFAVLCALITMWLFFMGHTVYTIHKTAGILALAFVLARLIWRLKAKPIKKLKWFTSWRFFFSAQTLHKALLVFAFIAALSGWLMSSASSHPIMLFGLWEVPKLTFALEWGLDPHMMREVHEISGNFLLALAVLHLGIVLRHHFIHKNIILLRMFPRSMHKALNWLRGH